MELIVDIKKRLPGFILNVKFHSGIEVLGLLGASGAGKSMTLRCIAGLEKPDEGRIVLNGQTLFDSEKNINIHCSKRKIGFIFQNYALFPNMNVEDNIGFALDGKDRKYKEAVTRQMIEMVKLNGLEKRYPAQLSGGQQQRVALARALATEPEALLLDEPFSALDDHLRSHMVKQLLDTLSEYSGVTLFVTHNMEEAYRLCTKLVVLNGGKVEAAGDKKDLFLTPPTLASGQLTGCKNFSAANYVSPNELEALDWGIKLKTGMPLNKELRHVGIRANYIRLASNEDKHNVIKCWPGFTSETPFRMTVYLALRNEPSGAGDYQLQWEVSKERWADLKDNILPWNICLNPENLILINRQIKQVTSPSNLFR
jgi:molybdate transport system ATP-binding protein